MDDDRQKNLDKINSQKDSAANVVRQKLEKLYGEEPSAKEEIQKIQKLEDSHSKLSKHQKYMEDLTKSGRSLAEIQTAWHEYYQNLPDDEKHQVWREFYKKHEEKRAQKKVIKNTDIDQKIREADQVPTEQTTKLRPNPKEELLKKVESRARKSQRNPHAHSLLFGLGMGSLVVFILLFSFFNERFITPFIRPSQNVSATSIIVDPSQSGEVGPEPKIIIPKINIEAPVVYDEPSVDEKAIQKALERGVVHYAITPNPGEKGNAVIVGHSSSNILNSGKYKFAFLLLKSLENDDTFIIHKDGKRYVYKVFNKFTTSPKNLDVLNATDRPATMTLITCDPPGSSANRLIIQGEQIFPDPKTNKESSVDPSAEPKPEELGSNSPSLWQRIMDAF
ncbi:sortase [Candidatus Saccharibacteria bacterium]|nr:sortase [Candidatus Saccharibacteria bacterium]